MDNQKRRNGLILESDKIVDELYYLKDILSVGEPCLSRLVIENLLKGLVFPVLFSLLASKNNNVRWENFFFTIVLVYHPDIDFSVKSLLIMTK